MINIKMALIIIQQIAFSAYIQSIHQINIHMIHKTERLSLLTSSYIYIYRLGQAGATRAERGLRVEEVGWGTARAQGRSKEVNFSSKEPFVLQTHQPCSCSFYTTRKDRGRSLTISPRLLTKSATEAVYKGSGQSEKGPDRPIPLPANGSPLPYQSLSQGT